MRTIWMAGLIAVLAMAGCGRSEPEPEEQPMKVEDTVFGDLVGTQDKARDQANAAVEQHKAALDAEIRESEDQKPEE
jgi:nitrous oxide reductase accessory protein NosL